MASSDRRPDYPLSSDLVKRLKAALDAKDEESVRDLICAEVQPVDAVIELANDDWMKDPSVQLPPGVLLGEWLRVAQGHLRLRASPEALLGCGWKPHLTSGQDRVDKEKWLLSAASLHCAQNHFTMERRPGPARTLQIFQKMEKGPQARTGAPVLEYHAALVTGDLGLLQPLMDRFFQDAANVVLEISTDEMEWQVKSPATFGLSGLWTLEYKRELTTPLCIAAAHGHQACVRHLLGRGANPDASPGGRGALHEACLGGHTACVQLLLQHGADPDLPSAEGLVPLHLCRTTASLGCALALVEHGASVQLAGGAGGDTPLHVAAQHGLDEHARLYLGRGARVDARNARGETALSAACGAVLRPDEHARCLRLCALLLRGGATADARDEDERSPLHKACGHARHGLVRLLLRHGADASALDYGGASPLARVLQTAACAPEAAPQRTVQALLNHGSPAVWPDAFPKVLKSCASAPEVIEVLFNSYPRLRVSESWKEVIPEEVVQVHQPFYQSLFALAHTPRCLQHLCRCAVRRLLGKQCVCLVPLLPLPTSLQKYLLLEPEGVLH